MAGHIERILIVEDSEFNAQVLSKAVAGLAPVTVAKTGGEAVDLIARQDFDVVLLDIGLPDIDGFEVFEKIIELKSPTAPPIIFVTSMDNPEAEERGLSMGAADYIHKPIVGKLVQARVNNQLLLCRARRELMAANDELQRLASVDSLTGVNNRRHFYELVDKELARADRYEQEYALMALDLDHFKAINDTHGHDRGDAVLRAVADAWTGILRANDVLGRVGGEEFSIFLPQTNKKQAEIAASRLLDATRRLNIPDGKGGSISVTASIGIAFPTEQCRQPLTVCADKALYEAKNGGRDRSVDCARAELCSEHSIIEGDAV